MWIQTRHINAMKISTFSTKPSEKLLAYNSFRACYSIYPHSSMFSLTCHQLPVSILVIEMSCMQVEMFRFVIHAQQFISSVLRLFDSCSSFVENTFLFVHLFVCSCIFFIYSLIFHNNHLNNNYVFNCSCS